MIGSNINNRLLFKLYLFQAYVDDGDGASSSLPPGARLIEGKVQILEEEVENDKLIPADIRTSEIVLEIANSVSDFIELTVDSPSRNETGWMPILDLQVQVSNNEIIYKFYKKEVSHHLLMLDSVVAFYPQTPDQELLKEIQPIISESCGRLGLKGKAIEMGGVSVRDQLCRLDLTGCIQPDCPLCESGLEGGSHTRRGAVYTGQCTLCQEKGLDAKYVGETGDSAYH